MHKREEVLKSCLSYFNGDEMASNVWMSKYCLKDEKGNHLELNPDDMHRRLAKEFARVEQNYFSKKSDPNMSNFGKNMPQMTEDYIYNLFKNFKYIIPGGSVMSSGGTGSLNSLSNCFVIDSPEDSYSGIMISRNQQVQLMKRRKTASCVA